MCEIENQVKLRAADSRDLNEGLRGIRGVDCKRDVNLLGVSIKP